MGQYFENDQNIKKQDFAFAAKVGETQVEIKSQSGVFSKDELDEGTKLLIETLLENLSNQDFCFCDLGCGNGVVGVFILKVFEKSKAVFVDVNERAVELAKQNASVFEKSRCEFKVQDGLCDVEKFDVVATNPPFRAGNEVLFKLFKDVKNALKVGGKFFVVLRKKQGGITYTKKIEEIFETNAKILNKKKGFFVIEIEKDRGTMQ